MEVSLSFNLTNMYFHFPTIKFPLFNLCSFNFNNELPSNLRRMYAPMRPFPYTANFLGFPTWCPSSELRMEAGTFLWWHMWQRAPELLHWAFSGCHLTFVSTKLWENLWFLCCAMFMQAIFYVLAVFILLPILHLNCKPPKSHGFHLTKHNYKRNK